MAAIRITLISALIALSTAGRLYVKEAGLNGQRDIDLLEGFWFCPQKFAKGFSIGCEPTDPSTTTSVRFYVNDVVGRREAVAPYTINGDMNGNWNAWQPTGNLSEQKIACVVSNAEGWKENIVATGAFSCERPSGPTVSAVPSASTVPEFSSSSANANAQPSSLPSSNPASSTQPSDVFIRVIEAYEPNPRTSAPLTDNFRFCPADFNHKISIECVAPDSAKYASIYVNGKWQIREVARPFTIAGDSGGNSMRWSTVPGRVSLACVTNVGTANVTGTFDCDPVKTPTPLSADNPSNEAFSGQQVAPSQSAQPSQTPQLSPPPTVGVNANYCVLIPATSHTNTKDDDWVLQPDNKSLIFRPNDTFGGALPPSTAKLYYEFEVSVESHYAITMASRTIDLTEHNDIWITFSNGVTLLRQENGQITSRMESLTGPLKSYHNAPNRYSKIALSVDHTEHTFSTTNPLKPGRKYSIVVGARSTQFQFYGLILFPCYETQCWVWGDWFQQLYLPICHLP